MSNYQLVKGWKRRRLLLRFWSQGCPHYTWPPHSKTGITREQRHQAQCLRWKESLVNIWWINKWMCFLEIWPLPKHWFLLYLQSVILFLPPVICVCTTLDHKVHLIIGNNFLKLRLPLPFCGSSYAC